MAYTEDNDFVTKEWLEAQGLTVNNTSKYTANSFVIDDDVPEKTTGTTTPTKYNGTVYMSGKGIWSAVVNGSTLNKSDTKNMSIDKDDFFLVSITNDYSIQVLNTPNISSDNTCTVDLSGEETGWSWEYYVKPKQDNWVLYIDFEAEI